jgi:protein-S-isoprenylcysteine O-methyltransferase Ste14
LPEIARANDCGERTAMSELALKAPASGLVRATDWIERAVVFALFLGLLSRIGASLGKNPLNVLLLISDGMVVALVMFRRRTDQISPLAIDWLLAFAATAAPLMAGPGGRNLMPIWAGSVMMGVGVVLSVWAKAALWRSFGLVAANRGVKSSGPYRWVRHPMYVGYFITQVGFMLLNPIWTNLALYGAAFCLQVLRLRAEEALLGADPAYAAYMKSTPYRLIPGLF